MKPRMFIASSVERLDIAYAAQESLEHEVEVTVWSQGVFVPSRSAMASLLDEVDESDFALFVLAPDDVTAMRDKENPTVRDNVIFELGLFIGALGDDRCFLLVPRGSDDLHLPSDLLGMTPADYDPDRQDGNLVAALGPACNRIRKAIRKLGPMIAVEAGDAEGPPTVADDNLCDDENDCISLIQSWMGARGTADNMRAIRFDDVDRELKLVPGSARKYIAKAAERWNYGVGREGKDTILFERPSSARHR